MGCTRIELHVCSSEEDGKVEVVPERKLEDLGFDGVEDVVLDEEHDSEDDNIHRETDQGHEVGIVVERVCRCMQVSKRNRTKEKRKEDGRRGERGGVTERI